MGPMERNKVRNPKILNLRLSEEDHAKISFLAKVEDRSNADMARLLFRRAFAALTAPPPAFMEQGRAALPDFLQPWDGIPATTPVETFPGPIEATPKPVRIKSVVEAFKHSTPLTANGTPIHPVASTLVWDGCKVRADGDLFAVVQLAKNVWQACVNGTQLGDWKSTEAAAKTNCQVEFQRRREARAVAKEHGQ